MTNIATVSQAKDRWVLSLWGKFGIKGTGIIGFRKKFLNRNITNSFGPLMGH